MNIQPANSLENVKTVEAADHDLDFNNFARLAFGFSPNKARPRLAESVARLKDHGVLEQRKHQESPLLRISKPIFFKRL
jgi:hypothetical protein